MKIKRTLRGKVNTILCADAIRALRGIPSESIDLTIFSPPYDDIRSYTGEAPVFDVVKIGESLFRVTKDGGVAAVIVGDGTKNFAKSLTSFRLAVTWVDRIGWKLFECAIYHRDGRPGAWWRKRFRVDHEYILIFFKGDCPATFNKDPLMVPTKHAGQIWHGTSRKTNGAMNIVTPVAVKKEKCRGTIWKYATSNTEANKIKMQHPATFPDKLAEDLILCFSRKNDIVLDPMCGSGTTCVMSKAADRRYIGIEIAATYCKIAEERLQKEVKIRG